MEQSTDGRFRRVIRTSGRHRPRAEFDPNSDNEGTAFFHLGTMFALATWKVDAIIWVVTQAVFSEARPYAPARLH